MDTAVLTPQRKFLFLQGPHGPFFRQLGVKIAATGASVSRIGFNRGDAVFWMGNSRFKPFNGTSDEWPVFLENYLTREGITDIVLYGDSRPIHKTARAIAKARGITAHCFEEGYLRPYWATYERGGTNGHSVLMDLSMDDIRRAVDAQPAEQPEVPVQWGSAWHHAFYGFLYHLFLSFPTRRFRNYRPHREVSVLTELRYYIHKLAGMPLHGLQRRIRTRRLLRSGSIYHLVLLQLSHDASLRNHSDFKSVEEFIGRVIAEFAIGAPTHHKLGFKAHPFEDCREPLPSVVRKVAMREAGDGATVSILGGVGGQGVYPIEASSRRLKGMLARAGGITLDPGVVKITVRRGANVGEIWFQDLLDNPANDIPLRAGDKIVLEKDERYFISMGTTGQRRISFETHNPTVLEALAAVGGLRASQSNAKGIFVFREEPAAIANRVLGRSDLAGSQKFAYLVDLTSQSSMLVAGKFPIRDEDTIYVTQAPYVKWRNLLFTVIGALNATAALDTAITGTADIFE